MRKIFNNKVQDIVNEVLTFLISRLTTVLLLYFINFTFCLSIFLRLNLEPSYRSKMPTTVLILHSINYAIKNILNNLVELKSGQKLKNKTSG